MAAYATADDLTVYVKGGSQQLPTDPAVVEALLAAASADVDLAIGPYPKLLSGLALDPTTLTSPQQMALRTATCAAAEYRLAADDELIGASEYLGGPLQLAWRGSRPPGPKVLEALSGFGLIRHSGCASPSPPPLLPVDPFYP